MNRDYSLYLKDILESIKLIEEFIANSDLSDFKKDKKTSAAVIHNIEIIGEASKQIPKDITIKHKEIPWKDMAGMRDKLIHFYFGVDYEIVWKVVKQDLPAIKSNLKKILKEIEGEV